MWERLTTSPAVPFFPLADVANEQHHKDYQDEASYADAHDEEDAQPLSCKKRRRAGGRSLDRGQGPLPPQQAAGRA